MREGQRWPMQIGEPLRAFDADDSVQQLDESTSQDRRRAF